jgi:hypothetical protein
MTDSSNFSDDACDRMFQPRPATPANEELKHILLLQTTRVLRRRRQLRQCGYAALLGVCYLAGMATVRFWPQPVPSPNLPVSAVPEPNPAKPPLPPGPIIVQAPAIDSHLSAPALERLGEIAAADQRAVHFFRAGDRYEKAGDMAAALRCYKLALDAGTESDLAVAESDSYLLMALKTARKKEKLHGKHGA